MNDSLELRKRILKMREVNNIVPKSLELLNLNNRDSDLIQPKKDNILLTDSDNDLNDEIEVKPD